MSSGGGAVKTRIPARNEAAVYITVREAAELLRLSEISIRRYLTKKILARYKAGGRTLLRRDDVVAMIKAE
jgi:excisionase family DNA binding protein